MPQRQQQTYQHPFMGGRIHSARSQHTSKHVYIYIYVCAYIYVLLSCGRCTSSREGLSSVCDGGDEAAFKPFCL